MTLADVKAIVLHELRGAGPLGLSRDELRDRISGGDLLGAVTALLDDGAVVERPGRLLTISAVQRSFGDALMQIEEAVRRLTEDVIDLREMLAESATSVVIARRRADELELEADVQRARVGALSAIVGGHALAAIGEACAAAAGERPFAALGARLYAFARDSVEARSEGERDAYLLGLKNASWIASYGYVEPPIFRARLVCSSQSSVRVAVLGRIPGEDAVLLCSPFTGPMRCGLGGRAPGGWRLHDDDARALREAFGLSAQEVA